MRYTIAYITGGCIVVAGCIFLLIALIAVADVGSKFDKQMASTYAVIGAALVVAAVQFILLGHLLTEIRALRQDNKAEPSAKRIH